VASWSGVSLLHGVDAHFDFVPPPTTGTAFFCGGVEIALPPFSFYCRLLNHRKIRHRLLANKNIFSPDGAGSPSSC